MVQCTKKNVYHMHISHKLPLCYQILEHLRPFSTYVNSTNILCTTTDHDLIQNVPDLPDMVEILAPNGRHHGHRDTNGT